VIPRFRAIPFGRELEGEVKYQGSELLNSYKQHRFAADLGEWYSVLEDLTAESWPGVEHIPVRENGPFIVKGETNSRRQLWKTHCFAKDRAALGPVVANLTADTLIGHQRLWIRRFEELNVLGEDVSGMPINEEYRVFYLDGEVVGRGFYWVNMLGEMAEFTLKPEEIDEELLRIVGERIGDRIRFAAVDYARRADGSWCVIEVNDGVQAGVCGVDPFSMWGRVATKLGEV
jgi:hypothetical protein